MSKIFLDKVRDVLPTALDRMVGYSEVEIGKIERLYGIAISGEFASFMLHAGRSDGGLFQLHGVDWLGGVTRP